MPNSTPPGCNGSRNLAAIRASRLNADGSRICPNTDGSAFATDGPISFSIEPVVDAGQVDSLRDGDGNICNTDTTPDIVTGVRGNLELCIFDVQMIEVLTGARLLVSGSTAIGIEFPDPTDTPPTVEFHWWTKAWAAGSQAATPYRYVHGAAFSTQWRLDTLNFELGATTFPLSFVGETNMNIVIGSFDDIPLDVQGDGQAAVWFADDIPDADVAPYNVNSLTCGYVDTPTCSAS